MESCLKLYTIEFQIDKPCKVIFTTMYTVGYWKIDAINMRN